ncbi:MAG: molybdopterin-dependent oxidoreductase [Roseovarius sp.]|nr:molybdopterin-dependent oxidoreductase [Roseovarius sp.]
MVQVGKNLIENKMPDAHWLTELMERGARSVVIAPEYSPSATKADYWISVRPGLSDTSIFLYATRELMERGWYDTDFVKEFTDFPILVRTDTLKRLKPQEVIAGYTDKDISAGPSFRIQGLTAEQRDRLGISWSATPEPASRNPSAATMWASMSRKSVLIRCWTGRDR